MSVDELLQYLRDNGEELRKSIRAGAYEPQPVRRIEIPKDNGRTRKLGIPTAVDRVIQRGIAQVLTPTQCPRCTPKEPGISPGGYVWTVDMENFFDTLNQSKLMEILSRDIKSG